MSPDRQPEIKRGLIGASGEIRGSNDHELALHGRAPVSLAALLGYIPQRTDIQESPYNYTGSISAIELYNELARQPCYGYVITQGDSGIKEYCVVGPALNGLQIHASLYYPSLDKSFGFDHYDVLDDENRLFHPQSKDDQDRLDSHRTMPGWKEVFEPGRGLIYATMRAYYDHQDSSSTLRPFIRWRTGDGHRVIAPDPFTDGIREAVSQALPAIDSARLDGIMGIVFLAAYSPDQTNWAQRHPYGKVPSMKTQSIEATQMGAFALRKVVERQEDPTLVPDNEDVQQSPILQRWEEFLEAA